MKTGDAGGDSGGGGDPLSVFYIYPPFFHPFWLANYTPQLPHHRRVRDVAVAAAPAGQPAT
jgi:hypothetical protein